MPLHPEIARFVAMLPPADDNLPDPAAVRAAERAHLLSTDERLPVGAVSDTVAITPSGDVPVRMYTPVEPEPRGILVYFHGGAFFSGSIDSHDQLARALAKESGFTVISAGYRLAPEAAYPAGLQDCYGVVRWAAAHGDELGWDGDRLAVAGDSSGANFAAVVAAMARDEGFDRITHQILLYPSVDLDFDIERYPSLRENARGYGLETAGLKPWNSHYVDSGADPADPLVSPIKRKDLSGLPAALIITAEFDPLRDEGERYGKWLADAGVPVVARRFDGLGHGFAQHFPHLPESYRAFEESAAFLAGE